MPGTGSGYAKELRKAALQSPVYQLMASGMTDSTAKHVSKPCEGSFREDLVGLRPLGRCSYVTDPAFGMIEMDWDRSIMRLQIRDGRSGEVAIGHDGSRQELAVSLTTCMPV